MSRAVGGGSPVINDAAQDGEQLPDAMNLVDDDELPGLRPQERIGIGEPASIKRPLEIEIQRSALPLGGDSLCQGRLADLTRPEQHDGWQAAEVLFHETPKAPCDLWYPGIITTYVRIPAIDQRFGLPLSQSPAENARGDDAKVQARRSPFEWSEFVTLVEPVVQSPTASRVLVRSLRRT